MPCSPVNAHQHYSEILVDFYWTTWHYNPEDCALYSHYHKKLKSSEESKVSIGKINKLFETFYK
jgi:hypothetical protein